MSLYRNGLHTRYSSRSAISTHNPEDQAIVLPTRQIIETNGDLLVRINHYQLDINYIVEHAIELVNNSFQRGAWFNNPRLETYIDDVIVAELMWSTGYVNCGPDSVREQILGRVCRDIGRDISLVSLQFYAVFTTALNSYMSGGTPCSIRISLDNWIGKDLVVRLGWMR